MASSILGCLVIAIFITQGVTGPCIGQQSCACNKTLMRCNGTFPNYIPKQVTDVELFEIESDIYVDGAFCNATWNNVRSLRITCLVRCRREFILENNTFRCLHNLEILHLTFDKLYGLSEGTFLGLEKVKSLDLSGCQILCSAALITALSNKTVLPVLSNLLLKSFGRVRCSKQIEVDQTFVDILGTRPLQTLDFSYSNVIFDHPDLSPLCGTLTTINFKYTTFSARSKINATKACESLNTLDLTGAHVFAEIPPLSFNATSVATSVDRYGQLYLNVKNIYMNYLLPKIIRISLRNCSLIVTKNNSINLEICGYRFLAFDVEFQFIENHLQRIALADNSMESIGINVFRNLIFLKEIDLSNNKLSQSNNINKTFQQLFRRNSLLENLYLTGNGLEHIPYDTFKSNRHLSMLDLSGNDFEQITFNVTSLVHLKLLDLRSNAIIALNADSRYALDTLYKIQQNAKENKTFEVDLRKNPFTCDCDSLDFIEWFVHSPFFTKKDQYTCQTNEHTFDMNEKAITAAKEDCERPKRRRRTIILGSVVPSITIFCVIGIIVCVIKQRRRHLRRKRFNDHVRLLQDDCVDFRFLVFLSFSSEDDQFVLEEVFTPLQHHLKTMCQSDKDLVCIGDRYFRPGQTIFSEMIRCLDDSAMFIAVILMSKNYCSSDQVTVNLK